MWGYKCGLQKKLYIYLWICFLLITLFLWDGFLKFWFHWKAGIFPHFWYNFHLCEVTNVASRMSYIFTIEIVFCLFFKMYGSYRKYFWVIWKVIFLRLFWHPLHLFKFKIGVTRANLVLYKYFLNWPAKNRF